MFSRLWAPALLAAVLASCGGRPAPTRAATTAPPSQVWQDFGLPTARGGVFSLVLHGQRLVAGGTFANGLGAGDVSLLEWSGTGWTPFAIPPPGTIESLASYGSSLIAARSAPGDTATYIEAWDGTRWRSLGDLNHIVLAMTPYKNGLAVGGSSRA